jgi:hypothetical protein
MAVACVLAMVACDGPDVTQPLEAPTSALEAKSQRASCQARVLSASTTGDVTADDCLFTFGTVERLEDLYLVNQSRLGLSDLSGANMLTFDATADFDAIYGVGGFDPREIFPTPVYGYARFGAGATATWDNSISIISSERMMKAWIAGETPADLGSYTLSTAVEPSIDTCENGHWVFIRGDVSFTSDISDATSCRGIVSVGPNVGADLNYQFWYVKLLEGETLNATLTGLDPDPTLTLAAIDFGSSQADLDFGSGPGATDRSVTFTATRDLYVYLEVSSAPGVVSPYTLTVDGP